MAGAAHSRLAGTAALECWADVAYDLAIAGGPLHPNVPERDPGAPISALRGAGVAVDPRRVAQAFVALCLAAVALVSIVLFVAGADKNAQINELRDHGVEVEVEVSGCMGLLGGSGSNAAGYACRGTYIFGSHRYDEAIPGDVRRAPGALVVCVVAPNDPALISTVSQVRTERPSWRVFIAPGVLALVFLATAAVIGLRWRRSRAAL